MKEDFNDIYDILVDLRGTPAIWQGNQYDSDYRNLMVYGYFKSLNTLLNEYSYVDCSLNLEGLI
jgi:hypothetical protein